MVSALFLNKRLIAVTSDLDLQFLQKSSSGEIQSIMRTNFVSAKNGILFQWKILSFGMVCSCKMCHCFQHGTVRVDVHCTIRNSQCTGSLASLNGTPTCYRYQLSEGDVLCQVQHALKLVNMEAYQNRPTYTLSGGQKQRIAIAGALAECPKASSATSYETAGSQS